MNSDRAIILLNGKTDDRDFVAKIAGIGAFPFLVCNDVATLEKECAKVSRPLIFVSVSDEAEFLQFSKQIQPLINADTNRYSSNFMHMVTSEGWSMGDCAQSNIFGHIVFRNQIGIPEVTGVLGRILNATSKDQVFGLSNFMSSGAHYENIPISRAHERHQTFERISDILSNQVGVDNRMVDFVVNAADELLMNAIFDAAAQGHGKDTTPRTVDVVLEGKRAVEVNLAFDDDYIAVTVVDQFGSLNRSRLLLHLLRSYRNSEYKVDPTVAGAGLGLAVTFGVGASLLFAVELGKRTEATMMVRRTKSWREFRGQYRFVSVHIRGESGQEEISN